MDEVFKIKLLKSIFATFNKYNVPLWLESGLLLGYVRDNDFIPWDQDFDLGTSEKFLPYMTAIASDLANKGYSVYYSELNNILGVWCDGWSVDIPFWRFSGNFATMPLRYSSNMFGRFLYYADWILLTQPASTIRVDKKNKVTFASARNLLCSASAKLPNRLRVALALLLRAIAIMARQKRGSVKTPRVFFEQTQVVNFKGIDVLVPLNSVGYVEYIYGQSWQTPIKEFSYQNPGDEIRNSEVFGEVWDYRVKK